MKLYRFLHAIFAPIFKFLYRAKVYGAENLPKEGGILICPNHISAMDVIIISAVTKVRPIRYMAKAELFKIPLLAQLIRALGAFPIRRGEGDVGAIRKTIKLLKEGEAVGMFPQGTRFTGVDPHSSTVKHGAGMVAYRGGVPVIPVAIITKDYRVKLFRRVHIIYGKPIPCEELGLTTGTKDEQVAASEKIFAEILKLHEKGVPEK